MEWMLLPLKRYAQFKGRSRRKEFWMFFLLQVILLIAAMVADGLIFGVSAESTGPVGLVLAIALLIPGLAVGVRRLHDISKSGWWVLIALIPLIGLIILIVFFVKDGVPGPNDHGPDPKDREPEPAAA